MMKQVEQGHHMHNATTDTSYFTPRGHVELSLVYITAILSARRCTACLGPVLMLPMCSKITHEVLRVRFSCLELDRKKFDSPGAAGPGIQQCIALSLQVWKKINK